MPGELPCILHVEDDEVKRYTFSRMLGAAGFKVLAASNAAEGLRLAFSEHPRLALLDVMLPDMSGFELCRQIKSANATASMPVLLISAIFTDDRDKVQGLDEGADGYLTGDVDPPVLMATIRALLRAREAEERLRASEEQFRTLCTAAPVAIFKTDASGRWTYRNPLWQTLAGRDNGDWTEALHPEDRAVVSARWTAVLEARQPWTDEFRLVTPAGETRWVRALASPMAGVAGYVGSIEDITERRRAEECLRESEERLRLAMAAAQMAFWEWDAETGEVQCSPSLAPLLGLDPARLPASGKAFLDLIHPDDRGRVRAEWEAGLKRGAAEFEFRAVLPDESPRWLSCQWKRFDQGRARVIGTCRDITGRMNSEQALREAEARFRRLYESNIVGIALTEDGRVTEANDVFLAMAGRTRAELAAGGIPWTSIDAPECAETVARGRAELLESGVSTPIEKEYLRPGGTRTAVLAGATLLDRRPPRWLSFVVDLTERKALERKLLETQKLESVGLLAGGIAHDFNNLLVGIMGYASMAQDAVPKGSAASRYIEIVVKSSQRAAHLTRQMLAYAGKGSFVLEPVDVSALVRDFEEVFRSSISPAVALTLHLQRGLPAVEADPSQLQQIVLNLVLNASEAIGDERPGIVAVDTGAVDVDAEYARRVLGMPELAPGRYVTIEVRDNGCGMDEATKARIFDPFFTTKFTGRGLGLAAVGGIVRSHKGGILVTSAPGRGSSFLVLLPAMAAPAAMKPRPTAQAEDLAGTGTVLVIDDEDVVLETARAALERRGYTVVVAASGPDGIAEMKRHAGDVALVLLDMAMPGMSGQATLAELRKLAPEVPVLVSSGYSETEALRLFAGQELSGFIQKPYTASALARKVKALV